MTRLTTEDCLAIGFCVKGQMRFCRSHGIDFRDFYRNGIHEGSLVGIDDHNLSMALLVAKEREEGLS